MSTAQDYINDPDVLKALQTVKGECRGKEYSDIIDGGDHQYVDLVMEGGGVLGTPRVVTGIAQPATQTSVTNDEN